MSRYNANVHKIFYASGFLYHPASERILLLQQKTKDNKLVWSLLGSSSRGSETSEANFKRVVKEILKLSLPVKTVKAVYNYHHPVLKQEHYVSYAQVKKMIEFTPKKDMIFGWFTI